MQNIVISVLVAENTEQNDTGSISGAKTISLILDTDLSIIYMFKVDQSASSIPFYIEICRNMTYIIIIIKYKLLLHYNINYYHNNSQVCQASTLWSQRWGYSAAARRTSTLTLNIKIAVEPLPGQAAKLAFLEWSPFWLYRDNSPISSTIDKRYYTVNTS